MDRSARDLLLPSHRPVSDRAPALLGARPIVSLPTTDRVPAIHEGIGGTFLTEWLAHRDVSKTALARLLGASESHISNWTSGAEPIPSNHWIRIREALGLSEREFLDMAAVFTATSLLFELRRLFRHDPPATKSIQNILPGGRKKKNRHRPNHLARFFANPEAMYQRILQLISISVDVDISVLRHCSPADIVHMHADTATGVCQEINAFLDAPNENLFTERNMEQQLRYPSLIYLALFLTGVTRADGPSVPHLQTKLFSSLEACAMMEKSERTADARMAQHALHVLARYRGDSVHAFRRARNVETQRMAYFGEVYRHFDTGPFEQLADLIAREGTFADATWAFDQMHYRDAILGTLPREVPPMHAMSRNIAALSDPRPSMRRVASARITNTLRRLPRDVLHHPLLRHRLITDRQAIEAFRPTNTIETEARERLLALGRPLTEGDIK
jgi:hypothetical protein